MKITCILYSLATVFLSFPIGIAQEISPPSNPEKEPQTEVVGWFDHDFYVRKPISSNATSSMTLHKINITSAPILFVSTARCLENDIFLFGIPKPDAQFQIGDPLGQDLCQIIDYEAFNNDLFGFAGIQRLPADVLHNRSSYTVSVSNFYRGGPWKLPKRDGIILLFNEGYALRIHCFPGWIDKSKLPKGKSGLFAVRNLGPNKVAVPMLVPDAVVPGKPVRWDAWREVERYWTAWVPFKDRAPGDVDPEDEIVIKDGLSGRLELPPVVAGRDVVATYVLGNSGTRPIWVWQDSFVQAQVHFALNRKQPSAQDKPLAVIDGDAFKPIAALAPYRGPVPIFPGEYLSFRRPILASELPVKLDQDYLLSFAVDAQWAPADPISATAPPTPPITSRVSATCPSRVVKEAPPW